MDRPTLSDLRDRAIKATTATRLYLGTLAEMLADAEDDEREAIRETVEDAGRDWYSDRMIAENGTAILDGATVTAPAHFWSKAFQKAIRDCADAYGKTPGEALDLIVAEYGDDVKTADVKRWVPEGDPKPKTDKVDAAIALILKTGMTDPRVEAMLVALLG